MFKEGKKIIFKNKENKEIMFKECKKQGNNI